MEHDIPIHRAFKLGNMRVAIISSERGNNVPFRIFNGYKDSDIVAPFVGDILVFHLALTG